MVVSPSCTQRTSVAAPRTISSMPPVVVAERRKRSVPSALRATSVAPAAIASWAASRIASVGSAPSARRSHVSAPAMSAYPSPHADRVASNAIHGPLRAFSLPRSVPQPGASMTPFSCTFLNSPQARQRPMTRVPCRPGFTLACAGSQLPSMPIARLARDTPWRPPPADPASTVVPSGRRKRPSGHATGLAAAGVASERRRARTIGTGAGSGIGAGRIADCASGRLGVRTPQARRPCRGPTWSRVCPPADGRDAGRSA